MTPRRNLIANYLGHGWVALMNLAFVPVYISFLGIESYGLIGLFTLLSTWMSVLDLGMSPTLSREMARFTGGSQDAGAIRDLLRTVEIITWTITAVIVVGVIFSAKWLALSWLNLENLTPETATSAIMIMAAFIGFRFAETIYRGCIIGLQRQVQLNSTIAILATIRCLGAVVCLILIAPTIQVFFYWQALISGISVICLAALTYRFLPKATRTGRFSISSIEGVWKFSRGMMGVSVLSLLLMQSDKVILSKILPLSQYGYYMLAATVAGALFTLVTPITQAIYPRMNQHIVAKNYSSLATSYHSGSQLVTVILGSASVVLIVFSEAILLLWTRDVEIAREASGVLSLLVLGNMLNGFMWVPHHVVLAFGWTRLVVRMNLIATALMLPTLLLVAPIFGGEGAAFVWVLLNLCYVLLGAHFRYRDVLRSERGQWYVNDLAAPLVAIVTSCVLIKAFVPISDSWIIGVLEIVLISLTVLLSGVLAAPIIRTEAWEYLGKFFPRVES